MQISLGVRFCKAFISKNYALDSRDLRHKSSLRGESQDLRESTTPQTPPARGGVYNDSPSLAQDSAFCSPSLACCDFTDFPSLAEGARGWVKSLDSLKKDLNLSFIPVLERRRLSDASKIAFGLIGDSPLKTPIVFSSQKGEINRCFGMLQDLAIHHLASPTAFSLSVLNATPALLAIAHKNHSEILAISAKDCLEYGLINAYMLLCEGLESMQDSRQSSAKDCLVISYDEKLDSKEISAIIACVSLEANLPQIVIKKRELQCNDSTMTSNLAFLSAVAGEISCYKNGDFAIDLSDFLKGFDFANL